MMPDLQLTFQASQIKRLWSYDHKALYKYVYYYFFDPGTSFQGVRY